MTDSSRWERGLELAGPDLRAQADVLRRRWPLVVVLAAVAAAAAAAVSFAQPERHRAQTTLVAVQAGGNALTSATFARTLADLVRSSIVAQTVVRSLRLPLSAAEVSRRTSVVTDAQSSAVTIRVDDTERGRAQAIAQSTATTLVQLLRQRLGEAAGGQSPDVPTITVFDPVHVVAGWSDPDRPRDIGLGAGLGLVLGLLLAFLRDRLDRRLRQPREFEAALAAPILATLDGPDGPAGDVAALRATVEVVVARRGVRTLLLAGVDDQAPVAPASVALARAFAAGGRRVALVEGDAEWSRLAEELRLGEPAPGLREVLAGTPLAAALRSTPADEGGEVIVLTGGRPDAGPAGQSLAGDGTAEVVRRLSERTDLVVLVAPTSGSAVGLDLARCADGVLLVCRPSRTRAEDAELLRSLLAGLGIVALGVVLAEGGSGGRRRARRLPSRPALRRA